MNQFFEISGVSEDILSDCSCEMCLLVAMYLFNEHNKLINQASEKLFTVHSHQILFRAMKQVFESGDPLDEITVLGAIQAMGANAKGINENYLLEFIRNTPMTPSDNAVAHLNRLQDLTIRRDLRETGSRIQKIASDLTIGTADVAITKANGIVANMESGQQSDDAEHLINSVVSVFDEVNQIQTEKLAGTYRVRGITTGFYDLDRKINEIQNGDLVVVAARPSMGKTAFMLNMASNIATNLVKPILIESIEMKKKKIARRVISAIGNIELSHLQSGDMSDEDWAKFTPAVQVVQNAPYEINDGVVSLMDIRRHARKVKSKYGEIGAIFIDYLQLIATPHLHGNVSEHERLSDISKSLKNLAMEFDCPVIALSQLSRDVVL